MIGYKVTDANRSRICGVACKTFEQLKQKGCQKLKLNYTNVIVQLQDGTIVDDNEYFKTQGPQTVFILSRPDEPVIAGYALFYRMLTSVHKDYLNVGKLASDFFNEDVKAKIREISSVLEHTSSLERAKLSTKEEDPLWFEGLDTNSTTKEDFMFRRSQERIRGYLYKTQDDTKKSELYKLDSQARSKLDSTFNNFKIWLKKVSFFGSYFNRKYFNDEGEMKSYCDEDGKFECQGRWNESSCQHISTTQSSAGNAKHVINPYESKEARVIFSTWNLDHRIERSRRINPALLEAAKCAVHKKEEINSYYFFILLFTSKNLKLVHIVCHDKMEHHGADCELEDLTTSSKLKSDLPNLRDFKTHSNKRRMSNFAPEPAGNRHDHPTKKHIRT